MFFGGKIQICDFNRRLERSRSTLQLLDEGDEIGRRDRGDRQGRGQVVQVPLEAHRSLRPQPG